MKIQLYEARFLLAGPSTPYALHQHLWELYGGDHDDRPFLYRADPVPGSLSHEWMVQLRTQRAETQRITVTPMEYPISEGERFTFSVRCVPITRDGHKTVALPKNDEAGRWLKKKADQLGFSVEEVAMSVSQPLIFYGKQGRRITINDTLIAGVLTVTDEAVFGHTLSHGFGRNKGFGFGMLQITPAPS